MGSSEDESTVILFSFNLLQEFKYSKFEILYAK